ncbi:hypothetical protein BGZ54_003890 [Gamsiella multidivaricata]|nr:hypothetical protein BGZ54_003890 [Gamsiella multidivaricata]
MGQWFEEISPDLAKWIKKQKIFFVATAPLDGRGCVNTSPKGHDCLRILGSGIETQSHLEENGRITIMMTAFEGGPRILRLIGTGRVVRVGSAEFNQLMDDHYQDSGLYNAHGKRAIILADVRKVGTSCGYAVPFFDYRGERPTLMNTWAKRDEEAIKQYWLTKNKYSLDGLPGMRHEWLGPEWTGKNRGPGLVELPDWATPSTAQSITAWLKSGSGLANVSVLGAGVAIGAGLATFVISRRR